MKATGRIILYTSDGRQLKARDYFTVNGRRNIVADWKDALIGKGHGCYYIIKPDVIIGKKHLK